MSVVEIERRLPAPPDRVWDLVMDPERLDEWVTVHRRLIGADGGPPRVGYRMRQRIHLRGLSLDIRWELVECRPGRLAVWRGRGPARSRADIEYRLSPDGDGTLFAYRNEFHPPFGPLGAAVSRALVGGIPAHEAERTLLRLSNLLESEKVGGG